MAELEKRIANIEEKIAGMDEVLSLEVPDTCALMAVLVETIALLAEEHPDFIRKLRTRLATMAQTHVDRNIEEAMNDILTRISNTSRL